MPVKQEFEYEYVLDKLAEVEDALAALDDVADAEADERVRERLVRWSSRLYTALASYESETTTN